MARNTETMKTLKNFELEIVDVPTKYLIGLCIRTTIPRSSIDCPPLWQEFNKRVGELPGAKHNKSYSLYLMVDQRITFDHWVAAKMPRNAIVPQGMEGIDLPGRQYLRCFVPNSAALLTAYSVVYSDWPQSQEEYDVDMGGPCFELYPPDWQPNEAFDLYVSIIPSDANKPGFVPR